jgi:hypothetical protein
MPDDPPAPQSQKTHLIAAPQLRRMPGRMSYARSNVVS